MIDNLLAVFAVTYSWLYQNLISPLETFAREFQFIAICIVTVVFIIVSMFLMLRQARKLPKAYRVDIADVYGDSVSIDGVRQLFKTYEAAESYARMYRQSFSQYKFRVVGMEKEPDKSH
ncbi:MAG: hypothetical protein ACREAY_09725 [Nitrososphaera sp.]|uniref:hypothetical protein n=1 Tax=Nitrososphaera sp. TaxID=1971748 RepID=UPI003D6ED258